MRFVSYRRVSTQKQGDSGLGLEAQAKAVQAHVKNAGGRLLADYVEVESGKNCERVELAKALAHARRSKATLIIGKLDRLSRNAAFLLTLMDSGVEIIAADNPTVNRLTLQILAVLAEDEARRISQRTKDALAALKARGVPLGSARPGHWDGREDRRMEGIRKACTIAALLNKKQKVDAYKDLSPTVHELRDSGMSLGKIAGKLNESGHTTRRGKKWGASQVLRVLRME